MSDNLLLSTANFHFKIHELPGVSFFAQSFTLPGTSLGRANVPTSNVDYNVPGDKMEFEDLQISFLVDEDLENYIEVFNWMAHLGFPQSTDQFKSLKEGNTQYSEVSDILLTTTTNKFNPNLRIHFVDCFPTDLTPIDFTHTDTTSEGIIATVTFDYTLYYFEKL